MENIKNIEQAAFLLQDEKILLMPSDTVLGIFGICTQHVINRLNEIKERKNKPYLVLVSSFEEVQQFAQVPDFCRSLLNNIWPGPLTCIFKAQESTPQQMVSKEGTIAIRVPDQKDLLTILQQVGPLFSTSANLAGHSIPESFSEINSDLLSRVDSVFVDQNSHFPQIPSTIVDCTGDKIVIIREGIVPIAHLG